MAHIKESLSDGSFGREEGVGVLDRVELVEAESEAWNWTMMSQRSRAQSSGRSFSNVRATAAQP